MSQDEDIYAALSDLVSKVARRKQTVRADTGLDSLGFDSLGLIELIFEIEERYDVELPFNANQIAQSGQEVRVGDLVDMVLDARKVVAA